MNFSGNTQLPSGVPKLGSPRPPRQQQNKEEKQPAGAGSASPPTSPCLGPHCLYIILNKPKEYVCSAVSDSHKTVYQLLPTEMQNLVTGAKRGQRLHTVGRLDSDTTGLLILTTDGKFSHKITTPENCIEKKYEVILEKAVNKEEQEKYIKAVAAGAFLPAEKKAKEEVASPGKLTFLNETNCQIVISEGKFHQVRRTFLGLGNKVLELKRIVVGNLTLPKDLKEGEFREMTTKELALFIDK